MPMRSEDWQRWLDGHAGRLLLFARQQCRVASDAEDVLQEALLEAWARAGRRGPPPLALVYRTVRRRAIDRARSADRRSAREGRAAAFEPAWFEPEQEGGRDAEERALACVATLPGEQREVLTLKVWGGLTFKEIGEVLEVSPNTAASRYRYALEALRRALGEARE